MANSVPYADQRPEQLTLTYTPGYVDLSPYQVLESARVQVEELSVNTHILSASHAIVIQYGDTLLCEVFACVDSVDTDWGLNQLLMNPIQAHFGGVGYTFSATCDDADRPRLQKPSNALLWMSCHFPARVNEATPVTSIAISPFNHGIVVETEHSYPNTGQSVLTRSSFLPSN